MCGIAGLWTGSANRQALSDIALSMAAEIAHRGPDDSGAWSDLSAGIALSHRRLSIVDLSEHGHQPMISRSGRYVMVFNGEVYNHNEIRQRLGAMTWRGHSDTEVMLECFERWGIEGSIPHFIGMFAFAVWDRADQVLTLVRDRLGIKPLYYGWSGGALLFGSELRSLSAYRGFDAEVNRDAIALLLRHNYIPAPYSIFKGISKLSPGHLFRFNALSGEEQLTAYWSAKKIVEAAATDRKHWSEEDAIEELHRLLLDAVRLRMLADVPLGAFLSGGIDSSLMVALMQAQSTAKIRTFSIGFSDPAYNEAPFAKQVANHLGTNHTELYVTPADALAVVPQLGTMYDEPFSDSSQIPTFLVSQMARKHVTVSLSGDGGDELFAGYARYEIAHGLVKRSTLVPYFVRKGAGKALQLLSTQTWQKLLAPIEKFLPGSIRARRPAEQIERVASLLQDSSSQNLYRTLVSHWEHPEHLVRGGFERPTQLTAAVLQPKLNDFRERMMYWDLVSYLPDDILTKVDRASMAVALEARVPLLDHRVVELAWSLPMTLKVRRGVTKWILRQIAYKYIPASVLERPKMGFGVPIGQWLRGPLLDWAESLLDPRVIREQGIFEPEVLARTWQEHKVGVRNHQYKLWDVLMFQSWLEARRKMSRPVFQSTSVGAV